MKTVTRSLLLSYSPISSDQLQCRRVEVAVLFIVAKGACKALIVACITIEDITKYTQDSSLRHLICLHDSLTFADI